MVPNVPTVPIVPNLAAVQSSRFKVVSGSEPLFQSLKPLEGTEGKENGEFRIEKAKCGMKYAYPVFAM